MTQCNDLTHHVELSQGDAVQAHQTLQVRHPLTPRRREVSVDLERLTHNDAIRKVNIEWRD